MFDDVRVKHRSRRGAATVRSGAVLRRVGKECRRHSGQHGVHPDSTKAIDSATGKCFEGLNPADAAQMEAAPLDGAEVRELACTATALEETPVLLASATGHTPGSANCLGLQLWMVW